MVAEGVFQAVTGGGEEATGGTAIAVEVIAGETGAQDTKSLSPYETHFDWQFVENSRG